MACFSGYNIFESVWGLKHNINSRRCRRWQVVWDKSSCHSWLASSLVSFSKNLVLIDSSLYILNLSLWPKILYCLFYLKFVRSVQFFVNLIPVYFFWLLFLFKELCKPLCTIFFVKQVSNFCFKKLQKKLKAFSHKKIKINSCSLLWITLSC